jgi:hypothetical protein
VNVVNGELKIGEFDPFLKNIKRNINVILKCLRVFLQLNLVVTGFKTDGCDDQFLASLSY